MLVCVYVYVHWREREWVERVRERVRERLREREWGSESERERERVRERLREREWGSESERERERVRERERKRERERVRVREWERERVRERVKFLSEWKKVGEEKIRGNVTLCFLKIVRKKVGRERQRDIFFCGYKGRWQWDFSKKELAWISMTHLLEFKVIRKELYRVHKKVIKT